MPLVRIDLWPGRTPETKAKAAREVITVLSKTLEVDPQFFTVLFYDVAKEDWFSDQCQPQPDK